jgi:hypothetical protein
MKVIRDQTVTAQNAERQDILALFLYHVSAMMATSWVLAISTHLNPHPLI